MFGFLVGITPPPPPPRRKCLLGKDFEDVVQAKSHKYCFLRGADFTLAEVFLPCLKVKFCSGFTLAEVFSPRRKVKICSGFTLAEVLITLGIIGVVAAITMPVLINKINDTVYENQRKAAQSKLSQAINMLHAKGVLSECSNTGDFVLNLKNELKILKVCSENELSSCFVEEFKQEGAKQTSSGNKTDSAIDLLRPHRLKRAGDDSSGLTFAESTIYTTNSLNLALVKTHQGIELAGVTTADGVNIIIGYESNCMSNANFESDSSLSEGMTSAIRGGNVSYNDERACVGAIIDANGFKKPNTIDKDILFYQSVISTNLRDPDEAEDMM